MKSTVCRVETVMELYEVGLLCKCTHTEDILITDEYGIEVEEKILKHEANCSGRELIHKLLNGEAIEFDIEVKYPGHYAVVKLNIDG